jgi:inosine-uridine nucleoside N-ribohydrolase
VGIITSTVQGSSDKVTLLALGPLTNVAEALQAQPSLSERLANVQVMGGAVDAAGNVGSSGVGIANDVAEWNIYVDPAAADVVVRGAPVTLVALDATQHAPITRTFLNRIEADRPTPEADLVYRLLAAQESFIDSGGYFFWDPLAAASMVDKSLVTLQSRDVKVTTQEGTESGRTQAAAGGTAVQVAVGSNAAAFETAFLETLNRRIE